MIRSILLAMGLVLAVGATAWAADPQADVKALSSICRADGALDYRFGDPVSGPTRLGIREDWGASVSVELEKTPRSGKLITVLAIISFERQPGTFETRSASASDLFAKIDAAITADGPFSHREVDPDDEEDVTYSLLDAAGEPSVELHLTRRGVGIWMNCESPPMRLQARQEVMGRTRVERPEPPSLILPSRPEPGVCADPARREAFLMDFDKGNQAALEYSVEGSRYNEHLAQWKGQQLVDKGVWSKARMSEFALSAVDDPIIYPEFMKQMSRVMGMIDELSLYAETRDSDPAKACGAAERTVAVIYDMVASNEKQWKRMHDLYDAEARRLKVTLD